MTDKETKEEGEMETAAMNGETPPTNETTSRSIAESISMSYITLPSADHAIRSLSQKQSRNIHCSTYKTKKAVKINTNAHQ